MRSTVIALVLALAVGSAASAAPYALTATGPPDAVPGLQRAIDDVRAATMMFRDKNDVGGLRQLRAAAAALERASIDPRTYASDADSPSNVTGVIETGTSVGNYLDTHGDRYYANIAWRSAIRAYDRRYTLRDARERRVVALFSAHRYREAFAVYAPWLRSYGFSPTVGDAEQAAFIGGLAAATQERWEDAKDSLSTISQDSSLFAEAAYALGWVLYAQEKHGDARTSWRDASGPSRTGEQPGFSNITVDAVRALTST